jgi:hypothetical protein
MVAQVFCKHLVGGSSPLSCSMVYSYRCAERGPNTGPLLGAWIVAP